MSPFFSILPLASVSVPDSLHQLIRPRGHFTSSTGVCRGMRRMSPIQGGLWALAWLGLSFGGAMSVQAQCQYEIVGEIKTPGCGSFEFAPIEATAMNDHGVVVGSFRGCAFEHRPFMWSQETGFVAIPLPVGILEAEPRDINNNSEIVGRMLRSNLSELLAFRYKNGVWTEFKATIEGGLCEAFGINDGGWVCGYRDTNQGRVAFRWRGDVVHELLPPFIGGALASAINSSAVATGEFSTAGGLRAFNWTITNAEQVPAPMFALTARGFAINDDNEIVGGGVISPPKGPLLGRSWLFDGSRVIDLGVLPNLQQTAAEDINNVGQIVGRCLNSAGSLPAPFLWQHGEIIDLRTLVRDLPDDVVLRDATAINSSGRIVVEDPSNLRWVILEPADRPLGDVNIDCVVDDRDLMEVLGDWAPQGGKEGHPADIVTSSTFQAPGDGRVDAADLAVILGNWFVSTAAPPSIQRR